MAVTAVAVTALAAGGHAAGRATGPPMPYVNFGGVRSRPSNYTAVLELGGRGIDTALTYGDEVQHEVATALASTAVPRSEIFLTTKVPCCPGTWPGGGPIKSCESPEFSKGVAANIATDVEILGKIDLLLLHWPCDTAEQTLATYRGLEAAYAAGQARAIGVSNFNASLLAQLLPQMKVKPAVNQCGHSIGAHNSSHNPLLGGDDGTVAFCQQHGITYSAYSPLGGLNGIDVFDDPTVISIGKAHNKSAAQVALKWLVQQNITVVTAADNEQYIAEDLDLFSFELSEAEMKTLAAL